MFICECLSKLCVYRMCLSVEYWWMFKLTGYGWRTSNIYLSISRRFTFSNFLFGVILIVKYWICIKLWTIRRCLSTVPTCLLVTINYQWMFVYQSIFCGCILFIYVSFFWWIFNCTVSIFLSEYLSINVYQWIFKYHIYKWIFKYHIFISEYLSIIFISEYLSINVYKWILKYPVYQ